MTTIPHPAVPPARAKGAWDDVLHIVESLGSALDPGRLARSIQAMLSERSRCPVEVYLVDRDRRLLIDPVSKREHAYPDRLAALLQIDPRPVPIGDEFDPRERGSVALALRDGETVAALARFRTDDLGPDPSLPAISALCGAAIARAVKFDALARLTGDSEHTRSMQQQILDHVSHEFNTPLMILRSSAEFARTSSEEERELFFDMHAQALDRLEQLVHGVIEVAHASAHGESECLSVEDVISSMVLPQFVDAEWPGGVPQLWHRPAEVSVQVERDSIGLAIEHLIHNAQQHAVPSGARVAVAIYAHASAQAPRPLDDALRALRTGGQSLPAPQDSPDSLFIEVIDDGPGIPAAELGLIFQPFTQASNSPLRGVSGAGMGLATATRLAEAAGGRIEVESALGAGSLFRLRLPVH